jgi:serine/threonine-protein kinase
MKVPIAGGEPQVLSRPDSARGELLQDYPVDAGDGEHLLYSSWNAGGAETVRVGVVSVTTGRSTVLNLAGVTPLGMIDGHVVYVASNSDVLAAPVDLAAGRVTGPTVTLMSGVLVGTGGVAKAALSRSGSLVFLDAAHASQLVMAGINGGTQPVLAEVRGYGFPRFSPDGRRIAFTVTAEGASHIWTYDFASQTMTRLTNGGSLNERPEWTPDGSRLMFRSDRGPRSSIWSQPIDQSEPASQLVGSARAGYFEAVMTPDAKYVVFQVDTSGADIEYRALSGDTMPRPIATALAIEHSARVSPDGRWVAFVTDESGSRQVVAQPFPGPGPRVQISTAGGTEPVWSRDGRRIVYRGGGKFIAADLSLTPTLAVSGRTELLDDIYQLAISPHANYDLSPDGSRVLAVKGVDAQRLIVVHDWAVEVRARLRGGATATPAR